MWGLCLWFAFSCCLVILSTFSYTCWPFRFFSKKTSIKFICSFLIFFFFLLLYNSMTYFVFWILYLQVTWSYKESWKVKEILRKNWKDNRQEGRSPKGGNRLQVSDIFTSLKWQEETLEIFFFLLYTNLKGGLS